MAELGAVAGAAIEIDRDVSFSVDEFIRAARYAFPDLQQPRPNGFRADRGAVTLDVDYEIGPPRRIALLVLPTLRVSLRLAGGDAGERTAMLDHLDRCLHRGGG